MIRKIAHTRDFSHERFRFIPGSKAYAYQLASQKTDNITDQKELAKEYIELIKELKE